MPLTLNAKEKSAKLYDILVSELGRGYKQIIPNYPYVLIRVLSREQQSALGIITPENHQKTTIEGVVLTVWRPFWKEVKVWTDSTQSTDYTSVFMQSALTPGEHVIFPHFEEIGRASCRE